MAAHQAPLSLGFSRQEYWSGLPFPSPMHACMLSHFSCVWLFATHGQQPTRLLCPLDSPGKNTGVGCHFLLQHFKARPWDFMGFQGGSLVKNLPAMKETQKMPVWSLGWNPPGDGNGNPLQSSCLGSPLDRGAWWAAVGGWVEVHGLVKSQTWFSY